MTPFCRITAGGVDITGSLTDRLMSIEVRDEAEDKSDRVTITLDDRPRFADNAVVAMPTFGLTVSVEMGYREGASRDMGSYLIDAIDFASPPRTLSIEGKPANMPSSFRTPRSESYHQQTVQEIVDKVAGRNGFTATVDPELADIVVRHVDQIGESDLNFVARVAGDHDAVAKPVAGRLVFAKRGTGKAITGAILPVITLSESDCSQWKFSYSARDEAGESGKDMGASESAGQQAAGDSRLPEVVQFDAGGASTPTGPDSASGKKGGVRAYWTDIRTGERKEVTVGAEPFHDLRHTYHNEAEAKAAASATKNKAARGKASFSCTIGGRVDVQAEAVLIAPFRAYMPSKWRIKSVAHRFEPGGGYTTGIDAELFDDAADDTSSSVGKTKPTKDDTVDKDAPKAAKKGKAKGGSGGAAPGETVITF
ncbi:contractile injection system protein, VgrG/Pvc8 family [Aureimonas glaciei]|uniref:Bacteriophage late control gene D protein n=1 Tax=Aureimonas glaciei TaxID=1776957 RepID=A0A916YEL2_9HYPH|nr:contractile injection system protein, VgrG/Pvc8 family [Aureimonas glaciei]GGD41831.1 bacteriophage late control gene D protein [Aureimonas glaciei]